MSLTDRERQCLSDISRHLAHEDPHLSRQLRAFGVACRIAVPPERSTRVRRSSGVVASRWFVPVAFAVSALLALTGVLSRPPVTPVAACGTVRIPTVALRSSNCRGSACLAPDCAGRAFG